MTNTEALRQALYQISLCSQNSASSKEECGRIARAALAQPAASGEPASAATDAIYAAWHGAGVDIAGGDWRRFVGMLPPLYAAPQPAPVAPMTQREAACILAINSALHRLGRGGPDEDIAAPLKRAAALFDAAPQPAPRVAQPLTDAQRQAYERVREEFTLVQKAGHRACIPSAMLNVDALLSAHGITHPKERPKTAGPNVAGNRLAEGKSG